MAKVLLHMEDKYSISGFLGLRQTTMVAVIVTDCIPVSLLSSSFIIFQPFKHPDFCKIKLYLCYSTGDSVFDYRVLLLELQSSSAA